MNRFRHIIWDWNGTLLDDAWLCVDILNRLLRERGLPVTDLERYQHEFMFPVETYYRSLGIDFSQESFEALTVDYMTEYDARRFECDLQSGARDVITMLAECGRTQSILSACEQSRLDEMVAFTGMKTQFSVVTGVDDCFAVGKVDQGKRLINELEYEPAQILMIGDTVHDYEVAAAMGIECILIPSGHCSRERASACGAVVLESLHNILTSGSQLSGPRPPAPGP